MKKWLEPLIGAWAGLVSHRLRSSLTILGVVIGVAAVIALMSIGRGAQAAVVSNIRNLGSNLLFIRPGFTMQAGVRSGPGATTTLTMEDAAAITEQVPYITGVAPFNTSSLQVVAGGQNMRSQVTGITPEYQTMLNLKTTAGDFISEYQYQSAIRVAVLGPTVASTLFAEDDPIGQPIRMGSIIAYVIGVLESKGASMVGSTDDTILVPLTVLQQAVAQPRTARGERVVNSVVVSVTDPSQTSYVMNDITTLLRDRHQLALGVDNDFQITSLEDVIRTISEAISSITMLLAAIAAISLLVGGIGVMNIMLVSVIERTREIGIRKALGARERDIWGQFLIEAAFLTFAGGVIGIALGWGGSLLVSYMGWMQTAVTADVVLLAVSVSVGIGLFFGFYPAWQASRLDPIVALRSE